MTYDAESKAADAVTIMPIGKNAKVTVNGKKVVVSKSSEGAAREWSTVVIVIVIFIS